MPDLRDAVRPTESAPISAPAPPTPTSVRTPPQPIKPWCYPFWVVLSALAVIAATVYSAASLPKYVPAARELKEAKGLYAHNDFAGAELDLRKVLAAFPKSEAARLAMAKALFADHDPAHANEAMSMLSGIDIDKSDWQELQAVMPPEDQAEFHPKAN